MNTSTALRELRRSLKTSQYDEVIGKFVEYLNFNELQLITCEKLKYEILKHYVLYKDKTLLSFVNWLTDDLFDFDRYEQYKEFRKTNKTDSQSNQFYKIKYGDKWSDYLESAKHSRHNSYSVSDTMRRTGCTVEEADRIVNELKVKTAPTLEKYIQKYGELVGYRKFYSICRFQKNYIEYWTGLYPNDIVLAKNKFNEYTTSANLKCVNHYLKKGYSKEEATNLISEHQLANAGIHRSYYEKLGLPEHEITNIMNSINKRKDSASLDFVSSKNPDLSVAEIIPKYNEHNKSKSSTFRDNGYLSKDDPTLNERTMFYSAVYYYTERSKKLMPPCPGKRGKRKGEYHIDHKYSRHVGFKNNIPPHIIGHIGNLQWMLVEENCSKRAKCSITQADLITEYLKYENKINKKT